MVFLRHPRTDGWKEVDDVLDDFDVLGGVGRCRSGSGAEVVRLREQVARPWMVSSQGKKNVAPRWAAFFQNVGGVLSVAWPCQP